MNRVSVLACIHHHLHAARIEPGGLRPLGELIPRIAAELRAGVDTSGIQAGITPIGMVAAFVDGLVSPQEELTVCQSILVDNSVLAELVAGVLALEESQSNATLPPLSNNLTAKLLNLIPELTSPTEDHSVVVSEPFNVTDHLRSGPLIAGRDSIRARRRTKANWLRPTLSILAVAASLFFIAWWVVNQSPFQRKAGQVVQIPPEPEDREPRGQALPEKSPKVTPSNVVQAPENGPVIPPEQPSELVPPDNPPEMPQVVVTPSQSSVAPLVTPPAESLATSMKKIQWNKIAGLLARREVKSDYTDDAGWRGVNPGDSIESERADDSTQLMTLPMSRAEADVASGGSIVLAPDTKLTFAQGARSTSAKVGLSHGLIAFVDMPRNTVIEFTEQDRAQAVVKWTSARATLLMTITDAGLQAQVTGGEVTINEKQVQNSAVLIGAQSVNEVKDRNTRLPAWVSRPVETIPLSKTVLGQLGGSGDIAKTLDRLLEASKSAGETDKGRLLLSNWRASLGDSNLLPNASHSLPLVRFQALQRLAILPDWDERYKRSWEKLAKTVNNDGELIPLRQSFELTRRGGKLNMIQVTQLSSLLESPHIAVRSLCDFILRKHFGGGPQFDPHLSPPANARAVGLWKRYINAVRNNP